LGDSADSGTIARTIADGDEDAQQFIAALDEDVRGPLTNHLDSARLYVDVVRVGENP